MKAYCKEYATSASSHFIIQLHFLILNYGRILTQGERIEVDVEFLTFSLNFLIEAVDRCSRLIFLHFKCRGSEKFTFEFF